VTVPIPRWLRAEALEHAERANVELRELAHGILPDVRVESPSDGGTVIAAAIPIGR
jgi:hypothetical protein